MTPIHQLSPELALQSLRSGWTGLTESDAAHRLGEFGPNRIERVRGTPLYRRLLGTVTHFFAIILWLAAALAWFAERSDPGKGMATLGFAIVMVILINAVFSFWQEYRAESTINALERLLPRRVKVMRDGQPRETDIVNLIPGDVIILAGGDDIPADCRLIEAFGVQVNLANITGEAMPLALHAASSKATELLRSGNILFAGTSMLAGEARALVFATGKHTEFGKIAHLAQTARAAVSPLQKEIIHISWIIAILALALGVVFFWIGNIIGLSFWASFMFGIGIIVANVPEGLLPTVTLALALGAQRMARRNALIHHLSSVETLGAATVICTDKTGTLTQNRIEAKVCYLGRDFTSVTALLDNPASSSMYRRFFEAAFFCNTLDNKPVSGAGGDALDLALARMAERILQKQRDYARIDIFPFEAARRMLSTLHQTGDGRVLYSKGALAALLPRCNTIEIAGKSCPLTADLQAEILCAEETLAGQGMRVLAVAVRHLPDSYVREHIEEEMTFLGLVGLEDPPRAEVPDAIRRCKEAGIRIIMVTGDHPSTALAVARNIGLVRGEHPLVVTGEQLHEMTRVQLSAVLDDSEILFARVDPDQKLLIVTALKDKNEVVAVTGDGVNDAPALRQADIGIAMGMSGTDVAREAADMILLDDNFATIVYAVEEGRCVFQNIRKFLTYILTSNIPEIAPYLAFALFKIPLPLTVIQILAVDLGTDMLPALALGVERPDPEAMKRPPRPRSQRLLDRGLLLRAYLFLGPIEALAAMAAFFFVLKDGGWRYGEILQSDNVLYLQATTACLSAIIVMQIVNVILCRSERVSCFTRGLLSNRLILPAILIEIGIILWIVYTPWGNHLFGTSPIDGGVWLIAVFFAAAMLLMEELRKWLVRRKSGA